MMGRLAAGVALLLVGCSAAAPEPFGNRQGDFVALEDAFSEATKNDSRATSVAPANIPALYMSESQIVQATIPVDASTLKWGIENFEHRVHAVTTGTYDVGNALPSPTTAAHPLCSHEAAQAGQEAAVPAFAHANAGRTVSFTVCGGESYNQMIPDVVAMSTRIGFDANFFVCLDQQCVDAACSHGAFAFLYSAKTKAHVAEAKYGTSALLSLHVESFIFFEMDVWFIHTPLPLLAQLGKGEVDLQLSGHQSNGNSVNIGVYQVYGSNLTFAFFQALLEIMQEHPTTFDQNMLRRCIAQIWDVKKTKFLRYRGNSDTLSNEIIPECTPEHFEDADEYHPACCPVPVQVLEKLKFHLLDANAVVSAQNPIIVQSTTIAAHILSEAPLSSGAAKIISAKERMLWEGADGYYDDPSAKYIMLEANLVDCNSGPPNDRTGSGSTVTETMLTYLVAIAAGTGRIIIMPRVLTKLGLERLAANSLNVGSVDKLLSQGSAPYSWRESTFLQHKKTRIGGPRSTSDPSRPSTSRLVIWDDAVGVQPDVWDGAVDVYQGDIHKLMKSSSQSDAGLLIVDMKFVSQWAKVETQCFQCIRLHLTFCSFFDDWADREPRGYSYEDGDPHTMREASMISHEARSFCMKPASDGNGVANCTC
jgi:hypothetical protein